MLEQTENASPAVAVTTDGRVMVAVVVREKNRERIWVADVDWTPSAFYQDGRWLAYPIGLSVDDREAAEKANRPIRNALGLLHVHQTSLVADLLDEHVIPPTLESHLPIAMLTLDGML